MLKYKETNWKDEKGIKFHQYDLILKAADPSKTRKEQ